jgi:hypothetical protein
MRGMELEGLGAELGQMEVLCVDFPAVSMPKEGFFELLRKKQKICIYRIVVVISRVFPIFISHFIGKCISF